MERVKGIEPSYAAWEAAVLPLNYTRAARRRDRRRAAAYKLDTLTTQSHRAYVASAGAGRPS